VSAPVGAPLLPAVVNKPAPLLPAPVAGSIAVAAVLAPAPVVLPQTPAVLREMAFAKVPA